MKTKILVVDDNEGLVGVIKEYFSSRKKIEVTDVAYDGAEALEKIQNNPGGFDLILLDLIMPKKDGISVLRYIKENKVDIRVIVMTSYDEEDTIKDVSRFGVRYYALKPFELPDLEFKITSMMESFEENKKILELGNKDIQQAVSRLLHNLGMPSHIKGYQFIRSAIIMVYKDPKLIGGITKELYPDLSIKYNTSVSRVERAIRHAIEVSWLRGDIELMTEIFGNSVDIDKSKPTNSEFIVTIADKLRIEKDYIKN